MSEPTNSPSPGATGHGEDITPEHPVVALGGGPAGLTAGYLMAKQGKPVIVLESTDQV
ncbi:MAG: NAD(P)-binding protein, partial [Solirubrobacteraceae bacterium]